MKSSIDTRSILTVDPPEASREAQLTDEVHRFGGQKEAPREILDPSLVNQYAENLNALHDAERALADAALTIASYHARHKDLRLSIFDGGVAIQVGAMDPRSEVARLESKYERCRRRFHELLAEHSALKKALGLCR